MADPIRIATFHTELSRKGPGLMLADLLSGSDPQVAAVAAVIAAADADVLLLQGIDWDLHGAGIAALANTLASAGALYPHRVALQPNSGMATDLDLDGDGRIGRAGDSQGWGAFTGVGGMALLSRLQVAEVTNLSDLLWSDLPFATLPVGITPEAQAIQRLSTRGHWDVALELPSGGRLHVLAYHATPPIPDGPAERNIRRSGDETLLWAAYLDGALNLSPPDTPVIVAGIANIDPEDGDGRHAAIGTLLAHPRLADPAPTSLGGATALDPGQRGDPTRDTASFPNGPGNLRVSYLLPDRRLEVTGAGILWPTPDDAFAATVAAASRHRLVWVDIETDR